VISTFVLTDGFGIGSLVKTLIGKHSLGVDLIVATLVCTLSISVSGVVGGYTFLTLASSTILRAILSRKGIKGLYLATFGTALTNYGFTGHDIILIQISFAEATVFFKIILFYK
jgi:hypothetical protein